MIKQAIANWINARAEAQRRRACMHEWREIKHVTVYDGRSCRRPADVVGHEYVFLCDKCGEFKKIRT